ncbi:hypothetical protein DFP72DRAFT_1137978 [Ephemerocybe angulata]|uniref:Uncharacterized protein n=1 Tax=Ephemerocybe angulata TaxID=980116 RepID=A0A8H6HQL1_9AGAR|nr:hypothetical protein DFP72DRAFT_1137978 [Tulosesus angulatus]
MTRQIFPSPNELPQVLPWSSFNIIPPSHFLYSHYKLDQVPLWFLRLSTNPPLAQAAELTAPSTCPPRRLNWGFSEKVQQSAVSTRHTFNSTAQVDVRRPLMSGITYPVPGALRRASGMLILTLASSLKNEHRSTKFRHVGLPSQRSLCSRPPASHVANASRVLTTLAEAVPRPVDAPGPRKYSSSRWPPPFCTPPAFSDLSMPAV